MLGQRDYRKKQVAQNHNDDFDVPVRTLYVAPITPFVSIFKKVYHHLTFLKNLFFNENF